MNIKNKNTIETLRRRIASIERGSPETVVAGIPTGMAEIDHWLPGGGLHRGRLHDIVAPAGQAASATGFTAWLAGRLSPQSNGDLLWCLRQDSLYPHGLEAFGLKPEQIILAWAATEDDLLWSMEEGLRCSGLAAVIGDCRDADPLAQRRLQLAAEAGGVTGFLLREERRTRPLTIVNTPDSRWRITAAPSPSPPDDRSAPLFCWQVSLERARGAQPAKWLMTVEPQQDGLSPVTGGYQIRESGMETADRLAQSA